MDIVIDLSFIIDFFSLPITEIFWRLFWYFGWIPFAFIFLWGSLQIWKAYRQEKWAEKNAKFTLLAIDIPRGNEQSPKAVENLFNYLAGAHKTNNLIDTYWEGQFQLHFSFEIVSIDGYTQFLIYTPTMFRDLVESAVYSQYPDAEITEVDDYTDDYKNIEFPNSEYDIFGAEFIQSNPFPLPIKTYEAFEYQSGAPETHFKDPMATLMDLTSSLKKGEQLWYQILIIPTGFDWIQKCDDEVSKILGEKKPNKSNILNKIADSSIDAIRYLGGSILGSAESDAPVKKEEDDALKMMNLKPKQKKQVEGIEAKTSHFAFEFKIRMVYLAKQDVINRAKVVNGFVGYIKQFTAMDMNGLMPDVNHTMTSTAYMFSKQRLNQKKNSIFKNYIDRSVMKGRTPGIFSVEELATIWHFPHEGVVKAPLIQKAPGRKAEPPMSLPQSEEIVSNEISEPLFLDDDNDNIPQQKSAGVNFDLEEELKPTEAKEENKEESNELERDFKDEDDRKVSSSPPGNLPIA